jgi:hypothetical protein
VVAKDMRLNTVSISRRYHEQGKRRDAFTAGPFNWLGPERPDVSPGAPPLLVKVRHGPATARCRVLLGPAAAVEAWAARMAALAGSEGGEGGEARQLREEDVTCGSGVGGAGPGGEQHGLFLLEERDQGLAAGQYAVLYQGGTCLGAAKIQGAINTAAVGGAAAGPVGAAV